MPWTSFCEYADTKPKKTPTWFAFDDTSPLDAPDIHRAHVDHALQAKFSRECVGDMDGQARHEGVNWAAHQTGRFHSSARVDDKDAARLQSAMDRSAVRIADRGAAYRQTGWNQFDPAASPYTADQIKRERALYR